MQISMRLKAAPSGSGMIVSGTATVGGLSCFYEDSIGPYTVVLPTYGVDGGAAPNSVDSAGDVTIAALISNGGADIVIPGSITYLISAPIAIPSGKTVRAATGTTVVCKALSSYAGSMFTMTFANSASLKNVTLDGNWTQRSAFEATSTYAIQIQGGSGNTVERCTFQNMPSFGVWNYNSNNCNVQYNQFSECYHPIRADGNNLTASIAITGNNFENTTAFRSIQGIELINTVNATIMHNTLRGFGLTEPTAHGGEGTWGNCIYTFANSGLLIENNYCYSAYWSAVVVGQSSTNAIVRRNYMSRGAFGGSTGGLTAFWFEQAAASGLRLRGNIINGEVFVGDTGGNNVIIEDNIITTEARGINVSFACTNGVIQRNTITCLSGSSEGVFLWEKHPAPISVDVLNNVINNFNIGIFTNNSGGAGTAFGLTVTGNTFSACSATVTKPAALTYDASCVIQAS